MVLMLNWYSLALEAGACELVTRLYKEELVASERERAEASKYKG